MRVCNLIFVLSTRKTLKTFIKIVRRATIFVHHLCNHFISSSVAGNFAGYNVPIKAKWKYASMKTD